MQLVCAWYNTPYPTQCAPPPNQECVAAAHHTIALAAERTLARTQLERVQIVALVNCVRRCFPTPAEVTLNLSFILIALATVITGTAKNHQGNDVIFGLSGIDTSSAFVSTFGTYLQADNWLATLPVGALRDVFGEFTWTKLKKDNFARSEMRLAKATDALRTLKYPVQIDAVVRVLKKDSPPIVAGKLTVFFTIATFTLLGLIHRDKEWREWAPKNYTASSGCVNWLKRATKDANLESEGVKLLLHNMLEFLPLHITFLDLENVACKAQVLGFNGVCQASPSKASKTSKTSKTSNKRNVAVSSLDYSTSQTTHVTSKKTKRCKTEL